MKQTAKQKYICSVLLVVIKDVKEGIEPKKEWIEMRLKHCLKEIEKH